MEELQSLAKALAENKSALDDVRLGENERSGMVTLKLGGTVVEHSDGTYDGIFFKAPEEIRDRDFIWYFNAPEGWANWYIVPLEEDVKQGFSNWLTADKVYGELDKAGEKERFRTLQTLKGSYFEPGQEYVIWFRKVGEVKPGEARLRIAFGKPKEEGKWKHEELEKALGLKPASAEEQVAELSSLGGMILLDGKFFDKGYADDRIESLFFSKRQQKQLSGGFFIQIKTSTPPCHTNPKLAEIIEKHGKPDFVRSSKEEAARSSGNDSDEEPPTITYFYDYFGFVVKEGDEDKIVHQVTAQANNFSTLRPKGDERSTFGQLGFENLTVFHFDGKEVGRIYNFDEEKKEPSVVKAPPEGTYRNGQVSITFLGDGKWRMEAVSDGGKKVYIKRYERNRLNGITEVYHSNGKLKLSLSYKDGVPDGKIMEYDEDGAIVREAVYKDGEVVK